MPTGYTAYLLEDGADISFKTFATTCARAFGACVTMRDDPIGTEIPEEFKPSSYHLDSSDEAKNDLKKYTEYTDAQIQDKIDSEYEASMKYYLDSVAKSKVAKYNLESLYSKVKDWTPPSGEFDNFKKFMLEQLQTTINHDCTVYSDKPKKQSIDNYRKMRISMAQRDIEYHIKQYHEEVTRVALRNKWIKELRDSINNIEEENA